MNSLNDSSDDDELSESFKVYLLDKQMKMKKDLEISSHMSKTDEIHQVSEKTPKKNNNNYNNLTKSLTKSPKLHNLDVYEVQNSRDFKSPCKSSKKKKFEHVFSPIAFYIHKSPITPLSQKANNNMNENLNLEQLTNCTTELRFSDFCKSESIINKSADEVKFSLLPVKICVKSTNVLGMKVEGHNVEVYIHKNDKNVSENSELINDNSIVE